MVHLRAPYLWHVTITTGHGRACPRHEVTDAAVAALAPVLDAAMVGRTPVPGQPGWTAHASAHGRCCSVVLAHEDAGPVLVTGIAPHSRCGRSTWRGLLRMAGALRLPVSTADLPDAPWVADLLLPGATRTMDAMRWTGDWSRCVAWTWMERRR